MHCDLNIPCPIQPDRSTIDRLKLILSRLTQLNDCTVALNYSLTESSDLNLIKPIDKELFDEATLNTQHKLKIYSRVTVETDETIDISYLIELRKQFDIVAIRTNDVYVFKAACEEYPVDIISLYCTERLSFELNIIDIQKAIKRQVYFEICYAPSIRDLQSRTYTLQLAKQLFEYTKGSYLILSSEAEHVSEIRNPGDVFYFAKSIGFPNDKAKFVTEKHCLHLLNLVHKIK